jgi:hypothetical protein
MRLRHPYLVSAKQSQILANSFSSPTLPRPKNAILSHILSMSAGTTVLRARASSVT